MFTGIVEEMGVIRGIRKNRESAVVSVKAAKVLEDLKIGDSVAVNGVCLTVVEFFPGGFGADVMHETLDRSTLGSLKPGNRVNLERAMAADGRFGGHIVAGHVDGRGTVRKIERDDNALWYTIGAGREILRYVVEKGSIAIDGISLTVAKVSEESFQVSVIPHTARETVLQDRKPGDEVNLETDVIGKYVERFLAFPAETDKKKNMAGEGITMEILRKYGF